MTAKIQLLILGVFLIAITGYAQESANPQRATLIIKAESMIEIPSIASQVAAGQFIPAKSINKEVNPKRRDGNKAVPGKGLPKGKDPLWNDQSSAIKYRINEPIFTFEAVSANVTPTDPTGAVGVDHFVNAWNSSFRIWDKEGNPITPPASLGTIFPGHTMGDPIVMYDQFADRFLITQFYSNGFLIAVSQGPDPYNNGWYTYQFPTNTFPDYPKYSVWSDGYYITANKNSSSAGTSEVVYVLERDKMIAGDPDVIMIGFPLPTITTSGFFSPLGFNASGNELPPPGNAPIIYQQDDSWSGVSYDHLKIWTVNVDWVMPANSTISDPQIIDTEPFDGLFDGGSFSNLPQPSGPDIDALQAIIMYMAQYRRFADYNSVVFNFVVDLDGGDDYAGIRWYELRQPGHGDPWEIFQEGTYAQPDGYSAFSGTLCQDAFGNIALAYTIVSENQYPSLRYTGRFASDEPGIMTLEEWSIAEGTQSNPSFRYGDYSQMTVDPIDDLTFWSIGEYFKSGSRKNQVGVFKIASDFDNDVGIKSIDFPVNGILSDSVPVTVTIRNYGANDQAGIPVSYQIEDGQIINETFQDTLPSNTNQQYTFETTGDFSIVGHTYPIHATTYLADDQNEDNNSHTAYVRHLFAHDLGVTEVLAPTSGIELSSTENITVRVENFGAESQSDFDVSYSLNGESPVTEQISGPLGTEEDMTYTFDETGDFSPIMDHHLHVGTSLTSDGDPANDTISVIITNSLCQPESNCTQGIGIFALQLGSIDNESGCDPNGYGDYLHLSTNLGQGTSNDLTITTGFGNVIVKTWIDFNDNFVFDPDEVVVNDFEIAHGQGTGTFTETMPLDIPEDANIGEHLMRVKANYFQSVPEDACQATMFGETEDYKVVIDYATGTSIQSLEPNDLIVYTLGNNQFRVRFTPVHLEETLIITLHNLQGQTLIYNRVDYVNGKYQYDFDMSFAPKGIYLVRLGSGDFGKVKRILVQ